MLDDEAVEHSLEEAILVKNVLSMDLDHFHRYRDNVSASFIRFGTYFFRCVGKALACSTVKDAVKILTMWPSEASEHDILYRIYLAKEEARKIQNSCL